MLSVMSSTSYHIIKNKPFFKGFFAEEKIEYFYTGGGGIIPLSSIFFQEEELLLHHPFQFGVELNLLFPSNFPGELTARSREKEEEVKLSQFYFYL